MESLQRSQIVFRLTALWAFTESGIGGVLHLFKLPFSGVLLTGLSISVLLLIFHYSDKPFFQVFRSLIIVLLIKFTLSPFAPPTAHLAVTFQACVSFIIYRVFSINSISIFLVCVLTFLESAAQKILTLVLLFGNDLTKVIDDFVDHYLGFLKFINSSGAYAILSLYLFIYAICAFVVSILLIKIFGIVKSINEDSLKIISVNVEWSENLNKNSKKRINYKPWIILILTSILIFLFSGIRSSLINFLIRPIIIILIWFLVLLPGIRFLLNKFYSKKANELKEDLLRIKEFIPTVRMYYLSALEYSSTKPWSRRFQAFVERLLTLFIYAPEIINNK